jgi:pimeloyl-ACP methyl ester carboxylesterase
MAYAESDGVRLYYEDAGRGTAIIFIHEFGGDLRSWEPQVRYFARRYRCLTYNARGFPPSEVPPDVADYTYVHAADDVAAVLDAAGVDDAHVVGLSMGGFASLHFGLRHRARARSLMIGGIGYGARKDTRRQFEADTIAFAERFETMETPEAIRPYAVNPYRVQFQNKDPRAWRKFATQFGEHDGTGSANTLRGVLIGRPSLFDMDDELAGLDVPTLIYTGDEDEPCLEAGLHLKRIIPTAGLWILPKTGHTVNLEEPDAFNRELQTFLTDVDNGALGPRDPRSLGHSTLPDDD